jgi:hypothetical protein
MLIERAPKKRGKDLSLSLFNSVTSEANQVH